MFVDELDEIPPGAMTIFSAHGVAKRVEQLAAERGLPVIDATCPLVAKVHNEGRRYAAQGREIVLVGHAGHAEVEGTIGQVPGKVHLVQTVADVAALQVADPDKLAYITQTTLSVDDTRGIIAALKARFPTIVGPDVRDICYATQNRQQAVRDLAGEVDMILVVGSRNSSNSNRLREIGEELGKPSYLIDDADALRPEWFAGVAVGRRHRRCVGAGDAGAGRARRAAPVRRDRGLHPGRRGGGRALPLPGGTGRRIEDTTAMAVPLNQALRVGAYVVKQHLLGRKRYPLVLMLEPLFRCNLACAGCGKIDYPAEILNQRLSVAECMEAVDECGAPVVVIAGGEPLLHQEIEQIVAGRDRAQEVRHRLHQRAAAGKEDGSVPAEQVVLLVGASGWRARGARHLGLPGRRLRPRGGGDRGGEAARLPHHHQRHAVQQRRARAKVAAFFDDVMAMGVDGISVSPGYAYERAPDQQHFLNRRRTKELFRGIFAPGQGARRSGRSTSRRCSSISWPATRPSIARRGATRRAPISAGSGPAICSARATRRPSRS